jgi:ferrous iron transport protein B
MLMGFGCNVPAAMACRTLDNEQERNLTLMLIPFMSCGARAPIFLAFAGAFFPSGGDFIIWGLYLLGIVVALVSGVILKKTLFKGDANPFIIELPRYRVPGLKTTALTLWEKLKDYVVRAGTIIFVMSIVVWFLSNFGWTDGSFGMVADISGSILAMVGQWIAVIFTPLGFGFWGAAVALLSGFIAKESVVATFGVLTSSTGATAGAGQLVSASGLMALGFTPLSAASFMVFCLLYIPCMAAVATFAREFHSAKWTAFQIIYTCVVAYLVSFLVYGIGTLVGL